MVVQFPLRVRWIDPGCLAQLGESRATAQAAVWHERLQHHPVTALLFGRFRAALGMGVPNDVGSDLARLFLALDLAGQFCIGVPLCICERMSIVQCSLVGGCPYLGMAFIGGHAAFLPLVTCSARIR